MSPWVVRVCRLLRRGYLARHHGVMEIRAEGLENLSGPAGGGIMIAANHPSHADPLALYCAADRPRTPLYSMTAWQTLAKMSRFQRWVLRCNGCFSVNREGTDLWAVRRAIQVLTDAPWPLLMFPEGDIYHHQDRLAPFSSGPAMIALLAAQRARRPVRIVPCAIRYRYLRDCSAELERVAGALEMALGLRPRRDCSLAGRLLRLGRAALARKEREYLGHAGHGNLDQRIARLRGEILKTCEARITREDARTAFGINGPERIREARRKCLEEIDADAAPEREACLRQCLEDLHIAHQLKSYNGRDAAGGPTLERLAEAVDRFEEDLLGAEAPSIRGPRAARIRFGTPILIDPPAAPPGALREKAADLTRRLEAEITALMKITEFEI